MLRNRAARRFVVGPIFQLRALWLSVFEWNPRNRLSGMAT